MKPIFTPEDFGENEETYGIECSDDREHAAFISNAKLAKLFESWPVVYSANNVGAWSVVKLDNARFQARLVFIEELPAQECEHEPTQYYLGPRGLAGSKCSKCGVELKAEWRAK